MESATQQQRKAVQEVETMEIALREPTSSVLEAAQKLPPRDLVKVEEELGKLATQTLAVAQSCIYCRPVGQKDGRQQFAMGPSVRLTELAHQVFGCIWLNGDTAVSKTKVRARCMAFDLQTLNITFGDTTKSIVKSGGGTYSETQTETVRAACLSIARRNALLQQTRAQMTTVMDKVKRKIVANIGEGPPKEGETPREAAWKALVEWYGKVNITEEQLIELASHEDTRDDGLVLLFGIRNAIADGVVKVEDVFGRPSAKPQVKPSTEKRQPPKTKPAPTDAQAPKSKAPEKEPAPEQTEGEAGAPEQEPQQAEPEESEYVGRLRAVAKDAGMEDDESINGILFAEFGIEDIHSIPAKDESMILDYFVGQSEGGSSQ